MSPDSPISIRRTTAADFPGMIALCRRVYPASVPWAEEQLASHLRVFPEGQFVALHDSAVVGMASSLIVRWDDYETGTSWRDFTDHGHFTNHDPVLGRTLYGAEVMADPAVQGRGVGSALYEARRRLTQDLGLLRIRAGARLRGYHRYAAAMSATEYAERVQREEFRDPTLSFQLHRGFRVLGIVSGYLRHDPESLGHAAIIEWRNALVDDPPS